MTPGQLPDAPMEEGGVRGRPDCRRLTPAAVLAEMIGQVLDRPPAAVGDVVNDVHRLGEAAASALLDAGDLQAWELTTRVANEVIALAQVGWIPTERH